MNTVIKCCYNCKDRKVSCHTTCERYLDERSMHEEIMQKYYDEYKYREYLNRLIDKFRRKKDRRR